MKTLRKKQGRRYLVYCLVLMFVPLAATGQPAPESNRCGAGQKADGVDEYGVNKSEPAEEQLKKYETYLKSHQQGFRWSLHNSLRHLYGVTGDEAKSLEQCDIILANSPGDDYIMSILSGWKLDSNKVEAISNLLSWTHLYPQLKSVWAACLVKVGDILVQEHRPEAATAYYDQVLAAHDDSLKRYQVIASTRKEALTDVTATKAAN